MSNPSRVQPGVPAGGQFAPTTRTESDVELGASPASLVSGELKQRLSEARAARAAAEEHEQRTAMKAAAIFVRSRYPDADRIVLRQLGDDTVLEEISFRVDEIVDAQGTFIATGDEEELDNYVGYLTDSRSGDSVVSWDDDPSPDKEQYVDGYSYIPVAEALAYDETGGMAVGDAAGGTARRVTADTVMAGDDPRALAKQEREMRDER